MDTPQTIKPIETVFRNRRFRSRREARWAVFFSRLGASWEYEPEGFELPSGRYLPDFWLVEFNCWVEVKGTYPTEREIRLACELSKATNKQVGILHGDFHHDAKGYLTADALLCVGIGEDDEKVL